MIPILVTAYDRLPEILIRTAEAILGKQEAVEAVSVKPEETINEIESHLTKTVRKLIDRYGNLLILSGMPGESTCNLCLSLFSDMPVKIVTGVNLPMLFKVFTYRNRVNLERLASLAYEGGRAGINQC